MTNGNPEPLVEEGDWAAYRDDNTGLVYYFNGESGESLWEKPYDTFPDLEKETKEAEEEEGSTLKLFSKLFEKKEEKEKAKGAEQDSAATSSKASTCAVAVAETTITIKEDAKKEEDVGSSVFSGALNFFQSKTTTAVEQEKTVTADDGKKVEESKLKTTATATTTTTTKAARTTASETLTVESSTKAEDDKSSFKMPDMLSGMFQRKAASATTTAVSVDTTTKKEGKQKDKQKVSQAKAFKGAKPKKSTATKTKPAEVTTTVPAGELPVELEVSARVLPHPEKVRWGGEDAVFFRGRTFGVFDGVSGADKEDGKPLYSTTLAEQMNLRVGMKGLSMEEMTAIMTEVAELADECATGASTALSASVGEDNKLRVLNVGDCKLVLLRNGAVAARTKDIVHYFDCPYQMGGESPDRPKDGTKLVTQVKKGDTIVMGSDGIFDNLSESRICEIITENSWSPKLPLVVKKIIDEARLISFDETAETPYAKEAKKNRYEEYMDGLGGKLDDVSCIVVRCV
eukprot:CAMPEP_0196819800 /NCGR_PEP_ID=MMETSP1362-20130617/72186_1 /TAXON_ID=163516 /ORGANISM="Leptocylindrus danicus, Strain CCMP1856" /LENGTH=514 /DNA_ID=CAMNT_0042198405 /DNA_START=223 /DNA_END=1767 /DNA_ORIENTATION=+